ncbi:Thioredoxin reductase 3 [Hypsibius exemplaris]|uniref:thioredoxin-disulfide reductase (NADPH) n=1 Tax=Hypsibius exemplaris TaxID=2072580 RepID=A0A1W0X9G5_HYPEX|nr:Thioredoxin reductase 3 [Hypsibius exemplaris]
MAPLTDGVKNQVIQWISDTTSPVLMFSEKKSAISDYVKDLFWSIGVKPNVVEVDQLSNAAEVLDALEVTTGERSLPGVFIRGHYVGGCEEIKELHQTRKLLPMVNGEPNGTAKVPENDASVQNGVPSKPGQTGPPPPPPTSRKPKTSNGFVLPVPEQVQKWIKDDETPVVIFSKKTCPHCANVKSLFEGIAVPAHVIELDTTPKGAEIQDILFRMTGQATVPNVFIGGNHVGGYDTTAKLHSDGHLLAKIGPIREPIPATNEKYDYDLVIIGGGSGGLATSKEAARLGAKVAVFDYVAPSPLGTTWGLGGTCVNVGCIPKKLMHQAAILGELHEDAKAFGWEFSDQKRHNWDKMVTAIQDYIHSLNWKYKIQLRDASITYINSFAKFLDPHTVSATNARGKEKLVTSAKFVIATGGRPKYPDIPGAKEYCVTSDDLFALPYPPGKTLCVGASYVSLECGGFLANLGFDTTVMVRSILLRGFDQQIAERIGEFMEKERKIKFIRGAIPTKVELIEAGTPGRLRVTSDVEGKELVEEYNTVLFAIGRDACTDKIGLENAGVKVNKKSGKLNTVHEQTNIENIYAIGDVLDGMPELTPVAIQSGLRLARRLFGGATETYDYQMIPTTVFTPLEYGAIGLAEEDALKKFGEENIEVYHTLYRPLEWTVPGHAESHCYAKLICNKLDDERVVGLHILGPNAGEITQGYAVGIRLGATKRDFDNTTGIHPTQSEIFTTLTVTKSSGEELTSSGC